MPVVNEWHEDIFLSKMNFLSWNDSIKNLHNPNSEKDLNSSFLRRIAYDEIFANLLFLSNNRNKIKKIKKVIKSFKCIFSNKLINSYSFRWINSPVIKSPQRFEGSCCKPILSSVQDQKTFRSLTQSQT